MGETSPSRRGRQARRSAGETAITPIFIAANVVAFSTFAIGWLRGGHPERFGVMVLLLDHVIASHVFGWVNNVYLEGVEDVVLLAIFGWLALRGGRWWPFVVTASLTLTMIVHLLAALEPVERYVALSARLGLWLLTYLTLLAGVAERWLAGERPVSEGAIWRRVRRAS